MREAAISGTSFEQCTRHLAKMYDDAVEAALRKYDLWVARNPLFRGSRDIPLVESICRVSSDDTLRRMFFDTYWTHEEFYRAQMAAVRATRLSGDHTYKCVVNVGFWSRPHGKWKWNQQYAAVYSVLNEPGQVVTWCFAENEKSDSVKPYSKDLSEWLGESVRPCLSVTKPKGHSLLLTYSLPTTPPLVTKGRGHRRSFILSECFCKGPRSWEGC